ncbi:MAG: rRNA (pseudouridine1915-N3)-methyltransferase [Pseudomonadota bacterium]
MPDWVDAGVAEYRKRLPREFELLVTEVPLAARGKGADVGKARVKESEACLRAVAKGDYLVALDVPGKALSTEQLAEQLRMLRDGARNISLLVGGPDGLSPECLATVDARWSLSQLTFPHPIVRIILAEQIYRAWSILANHPYHRG